MSNFDALKNIVRAVAPGIATALGGPAAGLAIASLSNLLLGKSNGSPEEIEGAIASASPDMLLKLKELDLQMQQAQFAEFKSAREREVGMANAGKRDWTMAYLVVFMSAMYAAVVFFNMHIPDGTEKETLSQMSTFLGMVIGYYFGNRK
jgi:hypothetical protein